MENQIYFIKEEDNTTKQNALKTFFRKSTW